MNLREGRRGNRRVGGDESGFTFLEMMSAVAIIGVLAVIGTVNFQRFMSRTRQSEAKMALAGIYISEKAFLTERSTYSGCLGQLGYAPEGEKRFYNVGFQDDSVNNSSCGPAGTATCAAFMFDGGAPASNGTCAPGASMSFFPANVKAHTGATLPTTAAALPTTSLSQSQMLAGAVGNVSTIDTALDYWTINEVKHLTNTDPAL